MFISTIDQHYLIPDQLIGLHKDLSQEVELESGEDADDWFIEAMDRLLKISDWNTLWALNGISISLCDHHGKTTKRRAHTGDYIKLLDLKFEKVEKEYWIHIDAIEYDDYPDEDRETIALRLSPSSGPYAPKPAKSTENLPSSSATFIIERCDKKLNSLYHSRNDISTEIPEAMDIPMADSILSWYGINDEKLNELLKALIF